MEMYENIQSKVKIRFFMDKDFCVICLFSTDSWWKRHPVIINGQAAYDGGACSCRRLNEQSTALLDQWRTAGTEASETPTHTRRERRETEGLVEARSLPETREVVVKQKSEMEKDKVKIDLKEKQRFHKMVTETGGVCSFTPAGGLSYRSGSYQAAAFSALTYAGFDNHDFLKSSQASQACTNINLSFQPIAGGAEESGNGGSKAPVQLTSGLFASGNVYGDDFDTRKGEAQVSNGSPAFDLSALLADTHVQSFTDETWLQPVSPGWEFPSGLGLSEEVYHPLQFPGASYYNGFQENTNFEGIFFAYALQFMSS